MASYHMQINTGGKGTALEHAQYIDRDGRFKEERYGEVAARGHANMPEWAREDTAEFWRASDEYERANGNTYREYELALPRELSRDARVALVQRFAEQELGTTRPFQWAIHTCTASDGKEQPHVHLMFSDRQHDGIERGPEQFFKRYNAKNPERGGARKFSYGADKEEAARTYEGIRERWAKVQNLSLEQAGVEVRVDHRSLAAQGITREPEVHRGPAVSGIEARGEVSEVGERQREQMLARTQARELMAEQVRVVTREEVAAERVAARERRDLAREVTGADRAVVLPRVEADRREQLGRAQAAAERRVERRQGLKIGGRLGEKLITQARALRERIGRELERVKEWVRERFPDPIKQLKERSRDLFEAVAEKARGRRPAQERELKEGQSREKSSGKKRGMFDGLQLRSDRSPAPPAAEREVSPSARPSVQQEPSPGLGRDRAAEALNQSVDRYARAWMDAWRMREKDLPVLEHQKTELGRAGEDLDKHRPGARQDLHTALRHEHPVFRSMMELEGAQRTRGLLAGMEHEERIRRDPNLRAERLLKEWNGLEAQRKELKGWEHEAARQKVKGQMRELALELKQEPPLELAVKRRAQELGIERGSRLAQVLKEKDLERALSIAERDLGRGRGLSL
ncbi:MAG: MobA/MobL family protein [Pseudomonadota bacterium]|nr:MobA/MobL family protein [Pseudomonadota bacterium]